MAKSRSDSRSNDGSESKTPLIVALVFFVLATVILGVTTYLGFSGESEARDAAKAAEEKERTAQTAADKAKEGMAMFKVVLGTANDADLNSFRSMKYKNDNQQIYNDLMTGLGARVKQATTNEIKENVGVGNDFLVAAQDVFEWNFNQDAQSGQAAPPKRSMIDQVVRSYAERVIAEKTAKEAEKGYKTIQEVTTKAIAELNTQTRDAKSQIEALPNRILAEVQKIEAQKAEQLKKFNETADGWKDTQKVLAEKTQNLEFSLKRSQEKANTLKETAEKAMNLLTAKEDPFAYDKPQGKILSRKDKVVEINLGSADNLKPGLRFSVQPFNTTTLGLGSRLRQFKADDGSVVMRIVPMGSIEVVEILGPNLSTARITDEQDVIRSGIMKGDLLYNSVWRKGSSDHLALAGIFDLDGDGVDDITTVVRNLNRSGIVVDAYWDFASAKWVGEVNERTQYLIEGYAPSVRGTDANADAKAKMTNAISEAKKEANDRGMKIVKLREFFPRIGFDVNLTVNDDRINQAAARYFQGIASSDEGKEGK